MKKCLFILMLLIIPVSAHAELRIDMNKGVVEPLPIAITQFQATAGKENFARDIPGVISVNLEGSGLFKPVNPRAFVQSIDAIATNGPNFGEWRATGTQALVTGTVKPSDDGRTRVEFFLWDVLSEKEILGMAYTTTPQNWRRIAHIISDQIYKRLTGEDGYFDSRIVYVAESGPFNRRAKRLAIMDQDGANHKYLTDGNSLVLTPRFSPTRQQITYMSYESGKPTVYLYDISTGRHEPLGRFPGMTFAPRFSPDGKKVIMSLAQNGNTDIYEMPLSSKRLKRITNSSSIDTSPSFAPDGSQIVFESDRGGSQQLYTMNSNGGNVQRITFGKGRYANPVWSPRGDLIAFTRMYKGKFYIGVIRPDGRGERLISTAYHVEGPTWSPNGRVLSYFKERPSGNTRSAKVYTVDITGYNERWLKTPVDGSDPAWSPLNKP
ncbi:MAG: Tol-Pal system beta propeller repeat protein TolB [Bdellovibrionales bacterium]